MKSKELLFRDLIDIQEWQKIQDNFSAVTDVCLRTIDAKGSPITLPSNEPRLLKQPRVKTSGMYLPTFLGGRGVVDKNLSFVCQTGLYYFIAPLNVEDKNFGYLILGPVILVMRRSKEEYRNMAEELNLDLDELWSMILEIKLMSFQSAQSLIELIKDIGESILSPAYHNITKEAVVPTGLPNLEKVLNILIDVAFQVSQADIGSIMLIDKAKDELSIRVAKGISEDIVRNTKVKLGESISGIAIKERASLLIDDKTTDNRIKGYLNRPYIRSSMVIPIKVEGRIVGVMNLGVLQNSPARFDKDKVALMNKLIDLATVVFPSAQ